MALLSVKNNIEKSLTYIFLCVIISLIIKGGILMSNLLKDCFPEIAKEWLVKKNLELGKSLDSITKGTNFKVWWKCPDCESEYMSSVSNRTAKRPTSCPYCAGKLVNETNNLAVTHPQVAAEWDYETNLIKPEEVTHATDKVVGFKLEECGHHWYTKVKDRVRSRNACPVCVGKHIQIGVNDLNTTHPQVAKNLLNIEDKYKYTAGSGKKVDWKCPNCSIKIGMKSVKNIVKDGLACVLCSPHTSNPEFLMGSVLKDLDVEFVPEYNTTWSKRKQYDFYLPKYNTIIETHGIHHYEQISRGRTLTEEQENDVFKEKLAMENGIKHYIVIDTSSSVNSINLLSILENEELNELLDLSTIDSESILEKCNSRQRKVRK